MENHMNDGFPMLFIRDGAVLANSRTVAEAFGKEHRHVLDAVDNVLKSLMAENSAMLFREVSSEHPTVPGRLIRSFEMTRDGFTLLAMGFTGEKALRWKLKYIEAFNRMESELRSGGSVNDRLIGVIERMEARIEKMESRLDEADAARANERESARVDAKFREDQRRSAVTRKSVYDVLANVPRKGRGNLIPIARRALTEEAGADIEHEAPRSNGFREPLFSRQTIDSWLRREGHRMIADHLAKRPFQRRHRDSQGVLPFKKPGAK